MARNKIFSSLLLSLFTLLLTFTILELFFQWRFRHYETRPPTPSLIVPDEKLIWRSQPFAHEEYTMQDADGSPYQVQYTSGPYGFRSWGNPETERLKILVIGDSFTEARHVSNDQTYYFLLGEALNAEVFAYGGPAYNSIQEWMILRQYFPIIKPDLILWQFASNDFLNNSCENSRTIAFFHHNKGGIQPFLKNGQIIYCKTSPLLHWLLEMKWTTKSKFLHFLSTRLLSLLIGERVRGIQIVSTRPEEIERAQLATREVFREIKKTAGGIPVYLFTTTSAPSMLDLLREISEENHFRILSDVPERLKETKQKGEAITVFDGIHWSALGHRAVAEAAIKFLREDFLKSGYPKIREIKSQ